MATTQHTFADNTCWILGAGASFDCIGKNQVCVPLTRDLLLVAALDKPLKEKLQGFIAKKVLSAPTVEEALTGRLEHTIAEIRDLVTDDPVGDAARTLREIIRVVAYSVSIGQISSQYANDRDEFQAMNYMWLAIHCLRRPDWSVITLNYDLVLDWAFQHVNRMAQNDPDQGTGVRQFLRWRELQQYLCDSGPKPRIDGKGIYLKLHGDLDLYSCHNKQCALYRHPCLPEKEDRFPPYFFGPGKHESCRSCSEPLVPLLVPPGKNKTSGEDLFLSEVYSFAQQALAVADTWVVLGYSCPEYDYDVTNLMRSALLERNRTHPPVIVVISPEASDVAIRLHDKTYCEVLPVQGTFSSLVHDLYWSQYTED